MSEKIERLCYEIVLFRNIEDQKTVRVGNAYPQKDYYDLKLDLFPFKFYLSKNRHSLDTYKIFAKRVWLNGRYRLKTQIGVGKLFDSKKSHVILDIPMLGQDVYMSLYPKKFYANGPSETQGRKESSESELERTVS